MAPEEEDDQIENDEEEAGDDEVVDSWRPKLPPPERAAGIPADATWDDDAWRWAVGADLATGTRRFWAMNGALLQERELADGVEKSMTSYYPDGRIAAKSMTSDGVTSHTSFYKDGSPWCAARYRDFDVEGPTLEPSQILSERLIAQDGSPLREVTNEYDADGLVSHTEKGRKGLRFETIRTVDGRELRFYSADSELEVALKWKTGADKALAVMPNGGGEFVIDGAGISDETRRMPLHLELGGRLFAATIKDQSQNDAVKAFAAKYAWAKKVSKDAPFDNASVINFLTALESKVPHVADIAGVGLGNLVESEKQREPVIAFLEELGTPAAKHALERLGVDADEEEEESEDGDTDEIEAAHDGEHEIGRITLPSGTLVLTDMGALGQWSHEAPHHADLSGTKWAHMVHKEHDDYVDLVVTGPDAKKALVAFVESHGAGDLFDVTRDHLDHVQSHFAEHTEGLNAKLEISPQRIGHGQRLRLLHEAGLSYADFEFSHVNVTAVFDLPTDRELSVVGAHDAEGSWDHVSLIVKDTAPVSEEKISDLSVEEARMIFADGEGLKAWDHERSLDGLRDFVFWGGQEDAIAEATGAELAYDAADYLGWVDLPPGALPPHFVSRVLRQVEEGGLVAEVRPHSSHHAILRKAWQSPDEAGTAEIGGAKMCGLFSSVGDGVFPIYLEFDDTGAICRVTVKITGAPEEEDEDDDEDEDDEEETQRPDV